MAKKIITAMNEVSNYLGWKTYNGESNFPVQYTNGHVFRIYFEDEYRDIMITFLRRSTEDAGFVVSSKMEVSNKTCGERYAAALSVNEAVEICDFMLNVRDDDDLWYEDRGPEIEGDTVIYAAKDLWDFYSKVDVDTKDAIKTFIICKVNNSASNWCSVGHVFYNFKELAKAPVIRDWRYGFTSTSNAICFFKAIDTTDDYKFASNFLSKSH